jgi:hypothetical protein
MTKKSKGADIDAVVKLITKGNDDLNVVVGPMLWQPADQGNGAKDWYFFVSVSKKGQWYSLKIDDPDYEPPGAINEALAAICDTVVEIRKVDARSIVLDALRRQKPIVIHNFEDHWSELAMTKFCETLWPGERITKLRKAIEKEREQLAKEAVR